MQTPKPYLFFSVNIHTTRLNRHKSFRGKLCSCFLLPYLPYVHSGFFRWSDRPAIFSRPVHPSWHQSLLWIGKKLQQHICSSEFWLVKRVKNALEKAWYSSDGQLLLVLDGSTKKQGYMHTWRNRIWNDGDGIRSWAGHTYASQPMMICLWFRLPRSWFHSC